MKLIVVSYEQPRKQVLKELKIRLKRSGVKLDALFSSPVDEAREMVRFIINGLRFFGRINALDLLVSPEEFLRMADTFLGEEKSISPDRTILVVANGDVGDVIRAYIEKRGLKASHVGNTDILEFEV